MIAPIIARLKTLPQLKLVAGLAEYSLLDAPPPITPAAYVIPATTRAAENGVAAGGFRQRLTESAQIILVTRNLRDDLGGQATQDLAAVRDAVRTSLLGWVPVTAWDPLELDGGALLAMVDDAAVWRDIVVSSSQFWKP